MSDSDQREIDELLRRMDERLRVLEEDGDDRRVFLTVYRTMTDTMRHSLPAGRFLDYEWTQRLTLKFAEMYFEADAAYESQDDRCPSVWARAFEVAGMRHVLALEHALLGINAHITYDLPRAVAATMRDFGDHLPSDGETGPPEGIMARRRYDYEVVNFLLAQTTDVVQELLADRFVPLMRLLDLVAGRLDEYLAEMFLRFARTQGWHFAMALAYARSPDEERRIEEHLELVALDFVHRIDLLEMLPTSTARRFAHLLREPFIERDELSLGPRRRRLPRSRAPV